MSTPPTLALALLQAADWFDDALRARLATDSRLRLSRPQAHVLAALGGRSGVSIAELARGVGVTRQSMHRTVGELVDLGLLQVDRDPADARVAAVSPTRVGRAILRRAVDELALIEAELAARIGADRVAALREALAPDWGPPPTGG